MIAVIPVRDGVFPAGGVETVAECGGRAVLIGSGTAAAARHLGGGTAITIEAGTFAPGGWADALAKPLAGEAHVVLPGSPDGRDLAPRLAAVLERELFAGAISITPTHIQLARQGGLAITDVIPTGSFVATLQPGVRGVDPTTQSMDPDTINSIDYPPGGSTDVADVVLIESLAPDAATMDHAESPRILGGGAGLSTSEAFVQLAELSERLDASMGATRVITDRGWVGHERQIGTTGVVVDPSLYIAFGISGAVQHTSGLGQPDHIISVNTDPHCPMMQLADLAIVSDANAVITALLDRFGDRG